MQFNRKSEELADLLDKLCGEKESYNILSSITSKLKLDIRMGGDLSWSRAAVFIRSLEDKFKKKRKLKRLMKLFTIVLVKKEFAVPDYRKKEIQLVYNLGADALFLKLEDHKKEYDAYKFANANIMALEKLRITVKFHKQFDKAIPGDFWRNIHEITKRLVQLSKKTDRIMRLTRKPIVVTLNENGETDETYLVPIHNPDAVNELFGK